MEKTIIIDGKEVRLKCTGATPLRYKSQFGKDFFAEILKLNVVQKLIDGKLDKIKREDLDKLDFDIFYNIVWVMAKTADPDIPEPISWLDEFDVFPILEIIPEIQDMLIASLQSKKKSIPVKARKGKN